MTLCIGTRSRWRFLMTVMILNGVAMVSIIRFIFESVNDVHLQPRQNNALNFDCQTRPRGDSNPTTSHKSQEQIGLSEAAPGEPVPRGGWKRSSSPLLPRALSSELYTDMMDLLEEFLALAKQLNSTPVMNRGMLLGSWMYHDMIPWDDDMDVLLSYRDVPKWKKYFREPENWGNLSIHGWDWETMGEYDKKNLQTFPPNTSDDQWYKLSYNDGGKEPCHKFKVFKPNEGIKIRKHPWTYPFIDVIFYQEDKANFWLWCDKPRIDAPLSTVFPLVDRPYGRLVLKAPFDPSYFLKGYDGTICVTGKWDHVHDRWRRRDLQKRANCSLLFDTYPQVWATELGDGYTREDLKLGETILRTEIIEGPREPHKHSKRPWDF